MSLPGHSVVVDVHACAFVDELKIPVHFDVPGDLLVGEIIFYRRLFDCSIFWEPGSLYPHAAGTFDPP